MTRAPRRAKGAALTRPTPTLSTALLAAAALAAALASPHAAHAQEPVAPVAGRPSGGSGATSSPTGSGLPGPGLTLPPGLAGNSGSTAASSSPAPAQSPVNGSARRPGLRENRARRFRRPSVLPVRAQFRSTLAPAQIAVNVQPIQTGLPDIADPAAPPRKRPVLEEDPFAPVGLRIGSVRLFPVVGQSIGYDTNPNRTQLLRKPSLLSQTEGELGVQSDWSRHELTGFLRGAYNEYPSNEAANRPEGAGRVGLRLDATRDTQLDAEGHYQIDTQRPGNPNLGVAVRERPVVFTEGASAGITQRFNRVLVGVRATVDRADYDNAQLLNGTILNQADRNLTSYGTKLRVGYEIQPGFVPFVEGFADTRQYDRRVDSAGYRRSSDGAGARLGTTFEITRLLTGEVSGGFVDRRYQDPRLADLIAPVADLSLSYAWTPLTTIRATASAAVDETTIPGANGIRSIKGGFEVSHAVRRDVTLTAGVTAADYEYQGVSINERSIGAIVRADWRLNRNVTLRASYAHDNLRSSVAGASYASNVFLLGLRLQP